MANTDEAILDKIRKLLESAGLFDLNVGYLYDIFSLRLGVYSKVQMVVGRIFQRVPNLLEELEDHVEEEGGGQSARKRKMIELVLEKVRYG